MSLETMNRPIAVRPPQEAAKPPTGLRASLEAALASKRYEDARDLARAAIRRDPADADAWNALGVALRGGGFSAAAVVAYRRALDLRENQPGVWSNLGNALRDLQDFDEAIRCHERAVSIGSPTSGLMANYGVALRDSGRHEDALNAFLRALALDPNNASAQFDCSQMRLMLGDYRQGWPAFEWRWRLADVAARPFTQPRWDGTDQPDKTLLLWPEQGFGDTILSVRFAELARRRVKRIVLSCQPELARAFADLRGVDKVVPYGDRLPDFDLQCPLMSLPQHFLNAPSNVPPPALINVPEASRRKLSGVLSTAGRRLKVGIVWSGSLTFKSNHLRSAELERFLPLGSIPGVQLFSLQKGARAAEIASHEAQDLVIDLSEVLQDFADTAAAIEGLDLIIMTDSSVAHLAGSIGKPVWNLVTHNPYWLYMRDGTKTPWYPSMRLFRQTSPGAWDGVFLEVKRALATMALTKIPIRACG